MCVCCNPTTTLLSTATVDTPRLALLSADRSDRTTDGRAMRVYHFTATRPVYTRSLRIRLPLLCIIGRVVMTLSPQGDFWYCTLGVGGKPPGTLPPVPFVYLKVSSRRDHLAPLKCKKVFQHTLADSLIERPTPLGSFLPGGELGGFMPSTHP